MGHVGVIALLLAQVGTATALTFATLAQGSSSQILEPRTVVARSETEWQTLWREHSTRPVPAVDFSEQMVAGVFLGTRPTAGYAVEITSVASEDELVRVTYVERRPPQAAIVAQVLSSPYHLVLLPITPAPVGFQVVE